MDIMKEYGILYAKVSFPTGHKLAWLNNHFLPNMLPKDLLEEVKKLSSDINSKFGDSIIVKMDARLIPGCVTTPESINMVASAIYDGMLDIFYRLTGDKNCIRLVYGIGELPSEYIENEVETAHAIGSFPIMVKIGHFLDGSKETGMFKV